MLGENIQFKILSNDLGIGKGMIYENLIAETLHKLGKPLYYFSKTSGLKIDFISNIYSKAYLVEVKAKSGNTKSARTILDDPKYNVSNLLKLTAQNINVVENIITAPYYSSFYILNK